MRVYPADNECDAPPGGDRALHRCQRRPCPRHCSRTLPTNPHFACSADLRRQSMCCSRFAWEARRGEDCPRLSAGHTPHLQRAVRWPAQVWLRPTARCALRAAQAVRATHARDETPEASHLLCLSVLLCSRRSHAAKKTGAEAEAEAEVPCAGRGEGEHRSLRERQRCAEARRGAEPRSDGAARPADGRMPVKTSRTGVECISRHAGGVSHQKAFRLSAPKERTTER